ncbi:MAG: hypothetical protein HY748_12605 [Elusimicrobia bacterium]|nr:hypothetical protein [Elusimicrobiota bacterium]
MTPEELHQELDRLWAKVSASSGPDLPQIPSERSTVHDVTLDALALMKRQQRQKERGWSELLDAKERSLDAYRTRSEALEAEVAGLRRRLESEGSIVVGEVLEARAKLEAGMKALESERAKYEEERRSLDAILEATRQRLAAESFRALKLQEEAHRREQQYLLDLGELSTRAERHEENAASGAAEVLKLSGSLAEAKNALEKTLAELLRERSLREETDEERVSALKKVADLETHFKELSLIWEEERSQWRELWDRERSTWEGQRKEIESWEAGLRRERESWQAEIQSQETKHVEFVSQINSSLRESSETSARLASVVGILDRVGALDLPGRRANLGRRAKGALTASLVVGLALSAIPLWRHFSRPRLKAVSVQAVELDNPTGMTYDGAKIWVSQWSGELRSFDPKDLRSKTLHPASKGLGAYRPTALAAAGDFLWSVDSAQARVIKHKAGKPEVVLASLRAPGPAPCALAFDGSSLWLYDAATSAIYRQKGGSADFAAVPAEVEIVPAAMAFVDGRLWAFDSKSREMVIMELKDGKLKSWTRQAIPESLLGVSVAGRELWALAGPAMERPGYALVKYRY